MRRTAFALVGCALIGCGLTVVGCEEKKAEPTAGHPTTTTTPTTTTGAGTTAPAAGSGLGGLVDSAKQAAGGATDKVTAAAKDAKDKVVDEVNKGLDGLQPQIDQLKTKGSSLSADLKKDYDALMAKINTQLTDAKSSLQNLRTSDAPSAWTDLGAKARAALANLKTSVTEGYNKFMGGAK